MKIKQGYVLREVFGEYTVFSTGINNRKSPMTIKLNSTSAFIWKILENGVSSNQELVDAIINNYDVNIETAQKSVDYVIDMLREANCLE